MLIVITTDQAIIDSIQRPVMNAAAWAPVNFLTAGGNPAASVKLKYILKNLGANENLCITGHGNDDEIGDENTSGMQSWTWDVGELANLLNGSLPANYNGKIVLEVCSDTANSFASKLALMLGRLGRIGLSIYGYTTSINISKPFPDPNNLVGLQLYISRAPQFGDFQTGNSNVATDKGGPVIFTAPSTPQPPDWKSNLPSPPANSAQYNIPASKYYVVNETGNIMMATTSPDNSKIDPEVLSVFQEVAVFFAAMTKAITSTPRYGATKPYTRSDYYTIYDYLALEAIVNQSGMFVNVREEDMHFQSSQGSVDFNLELIEAILGVALTDGVGAAGLQASLNAMGKQATFSYARTQQSDKIANILFLCEYLFGMPIVNVLYFYVDEEDTQTLVTTPCVSTSFQGYNLTIHKDTFMFVLPEWIRKYAGDLSSVANLPEYQALIGELRGYINNAAIIASITTDAAGATPAKSFTVGTNYYIQGFHFGSTAGTVSISGTSQVIVANSWKDNIIEFTFAKPATGTAGYVDVFDNNGAYLTESNSPITFATS